MKKVIIATLLAGASASVLAEDPMREKAEQFQAGQKFAETLVQSALSAGKTGEVLLTLQGTKVWGCSVNVKNEGGASVKVSESAASPERACVKSVLALSKQNAL